mgnify:CR=1 FL=1
MNPPYKLPSYSTILKDGLVIPDDISQIVLFQGTSSIFRGDIVRNGLQPRYNTGNSMYGVIPSLESRSDLIYLARKEVALWHADQTVKKVGGDKMLVEVIADIEKLTHDEDAEKIFNVTGWKNSLLVNGTCAYMKSNLPAQAITVYERNSFERIRVVIGHPTPLPM